MKKLLVAVVVLLTSLGLTAMPVTADEPIEEPVDEEPVDEEPVDEEPVGTTSLVAVTPCRLLDTRAGGAAAPAIGATITVKVTDQCAVPFEATAAAITVTSVRPPSDSAVTVWPGDNAQAPTTSNLNLARGETRANSVLTHLGADGSLKVTSSGGGHIVIDVTAAFLPAETSSAGRFVSTGSLRLRDTRLLARPGEGGSVRIPLPSGVPSDARALALNITVTRGTKPGFVSVVEAGITPPLASVLNTDGPGQTRATTVIAPANADGVDIYTSAGDHMIVDMTGWFTGPSAETTTDGLFVPEAPTRLVDTRVVQPPIYSGGTREWTLNSFLGQISSAVAVNVTLVRSNRVGWLAAHPARQPWTGTSTVNAERPGQTVANLALLPLSTAGLALYTQSGGHAVIDLFGYFLGTPSPTTTGPHVNARPTPGHTLIVGDSTASSLRWMPSSQDDLVGFTYHLDVESCRRTTGLSCRGREGRTPVSADIAILNAPDPFYDTIVVMTGYNDWHTTFRAGIDNVMAAARARGAYEVVWMVLRTDHLYNMPGQPEGTALSHILNNEQLQLATLRYPTLRLSDWNSHSSERAEWFATDGIHPNTEGAHALARFITAELIPS